MKMKKKFAAGILTAMMLVFTMGTTVFAAPSPNSPEAIQQKTDELNKNTTVDRNGLNANNEVIHITSSQVSQEQYKEANEVAKGQDSNAEVLAMSNISVPAGTNTSKGIKVTISAPGIKSGDNVYVLHKLSSGAWQVLRPDSVSNGKVTVTLYSFSPVTVVKYSAGVTPATTTDPSKDENSSTTGNNNTNNNDNSNSSSQSNSNSQTNNNNQNNSQTNNQYNPVSVNQNVTVNYPQSYDDGDGDYDDSYEDGYTDGYKAGKSTKGSTSASAAGTSKNTASAVKGTSGSAKTVAASASGAVSYKTSPKTGAAVPALPVIAVFALAGVIVCGRKARNN